MPVRRHFRWKLEREEQRTELPGGQAFLGTRSFMATHAFTHMDAPVHMVPGAATTTDVALERRPG